MKAETSFMTKLIDTNILIYSADNTHELKHREALKVLDESKDGVISIQNLAELARAMTEKAGKPAEKVRIYINNFKESFRVIRYNEDTVTRALEIKSEYDLHFFDALIAATMEENEVYEIITENEKDFSKIPNIKVINPFKK